MRGQVVVLGASGLVGSRLCQLWSDEVEVIAPSHGEVDVLDAAALRAFLEATPVQDVVNLAARADVDGAEAERGDTTGTVYRLNVAFPTYLAEQCRRLGKRLVHVSTDYVFDGTNAERPYTEGDPTRPLCWYAETKWRGEDGVLEANPNACVARIEMPYTAREHAKRDLARLVASRLAQNQTVQGVTNQRITPVFLDDVAAALRALVGSDFRGIIHVAASTWTTPFDLAVQIARRLDLRENLVQPVAFEEFAQTRPARRPQHSWLDVTRFTKAFGDGILRPVDEALGAWTTQWRSN